MLGHRPKMKIQYASDLHLEFGENRDFIEHYGADYWIYGHTHYGGGSGTQIGDTTLLCNQLGYVFCDEHEAFDGKAVMEI